MGGGGDKLDLLWGLITKRDENGDKSCLIQSFISKRGGNDDKSCLIQVLITESIVHDLIESEG